MNVLTGRQPDLKDSSFFLTFVDLNLTPALGDDPVNDGKTQTRSLTCGLGRKEGFKDSLPDLVRHPFTLILNADHDVFAGFQLGRHVLLAFLDRTLPGSDGQGPPPLHGVLRLDLPILDVVRDNVSGVTFFVLNQFPLPFLTVFAVVVAAFLFIITSVVSAAFVLGMFSTGGDLNPSTRVKLSWGGVLGALGLVMILSYSIDAVKSIIALGALPFVFIVLLLVVCLLKALKAERLD